MSYNRERLVAKLKSLDETQPAIVSVSEWMLFYRDHAQESIDLWADFTVKLATVQKLPLLYVANEVLQKSRAMKRKEFAKAFASVLPSVLSKVYPKLDAKLQLKYKRVLDIWRDRNIFDNEVLDGLYQLLRGAAPLKSTNGTTSAVPARSMTDIAPELVPLSSAYNRLSHSSSLFTSSHLKAEAIYKELFENEMNLPLPNLFILKLDQLATLLQNLHNSLTDITTIRESLIRDMSRVISSQKELIEQDKGKLQVLQKKQLEVKDKRKELEEFVNGDMGADGADDDDDDDEMIPQYANSDDEQGEQTGDDADYSPAKRQQLSPVGGEQVLEPEEVSPEFENDSDSDVETKSPRINANLASLLSKLSE